MEQITPLLENPFIFGIIVSLGLITLLAVAANISTRTPATPENLTPRKKTQKKSHAQKIREDIKAPKSPTARPTQPEQTQKVPGADKTSAIVEEVRTLDQKSWLEKLQNGLSKTRSSLTGNLSRVFTNGKLNEDALEQLHEVLFRADVGVKTSDRLVDYLRQHLKDKEADWNSIRPHLYEKSLEIFNKSTAPLNKPEKGPLVILIVGVNGVGKTTTIGKLAAQYLAEDKEVLLCAADTFRAAAIDQLKVWGERLGVKVVAHQQGSDPAAVAYDGVKAAMARKSDVLIIDTAGRLHSKNDLMQELNKIRRVIGKDLPGAPHESWLVVDSTTGQNAVQQVRAFNDVVPLSGLVVTKLDGTAKGGVIIGISDEFSLPVRYIGVGESASDLRPFQAGEYLDSLFSRE